MSEVSKEPTEDIIQRMMERGILTREDVVTAAVDCLDFIMRYHDAGVEMGVKLKAGRFSGARWVPLDIEIPGLTVDTPG